MKWIRLTAFNLMIAASLLSFNSCERDAEQKKTTDYQKKDIPLTGAQEIPISPSTALGKMDVFYSKETRVLNYTVSWSALTGPVTAIHIHGLSPKGYFTTTISQMVIGSGGLASANATLYGATSKFSGSLFVDGVAIKEEDLLNGMYYLHIHTASYPSDPRGEIRGQIEFQ